METPRLQSFTEMTKTYERELVSSILRQTKREAVDEDFEKEANHLLIMNDEKVRSSFTSCRASIVGGHIASQSLCRSLLTLTVSLLRKRGLPGLNDRTKGALD